MGEEISLLIRSLPLLLAGAFNTLQIAFVSMAIGLGAGLGIGVLNCERMQHPILKGAFNCFIWAVRGTPLFVQVLIIYYALPEVLGFFLSPFMAGVAALGMNSAAYISEIVRGGLNAVPIGQWEAAYVLGISPIKTLRGIVIPQMLRITLPSLTNELTALIKETSILMVIGVGELTKVSKDIVARELDPMTIYLAAACLYLAMTSAVSLIAQRIPKGGGA